jgi:phosphoribosylaminoimidazole carboxylase (NCAIR synthetase)
MTTPRTVGIVGAGQLARMMAQAAIPLDIHLVLLAADPEDVRHAATS